jgi:hypothetical protein
MFFLWLSCHEGAYCLMSTLRYNIVLSSYSYTNTMDISWASRLVEAQLGVKQNN